MKKISVLFVTCLSLFLFTNVSFSQITSAGTGDWSASGTWVGGVVPGSADNVIIASGHIVTVDNSSAACNNISFGDNTSQLAMGNSSSILSVYGDLSLFAGGTHNAFSSWAPGAILRFTGSTATQTIKNLSTSKTTTTQTYFIAVRVDKSSGKVTTGTGDFTFNVGSSLEIINGTFELGTADDIQGRSDGTTASTPNITISSGASFTMLAGASHIGSGTSGAPRPPIGKVTINGNMTVSTTSTNKINFSDIDINSGGTLIINTGWSSSNLNLFNAGIITVKSGGTLNNTSTTDLYSATTSLVINSGGVVKSSSSTLTPLPTSVTNNGTFIYSRNVSNSDQVIADINYKRIEFSFANGTSKKVWTLGADRVISDSLEINNSAVLQILGAHKLTVNGTLRLTTGQIDNSGAGVTLEMGNGTEISRATGTIINAPSFSSINLKYSSTTTSVTTGPEMPTSTSALNNLILSGSQVITLGSSITVNGTLSFWGTTSLVLGGFILNYGPSAVLQYGVSGQTSAQTSSNIEWPASNGPKNVQIYNSGGVTLHDHRTIPGTLTLTLGTFDNNGAGDDKILTFADGATIKRARGILTTAPSFEGNVNLEYSSTIVGDTTSYEMPLSTSALNNLTISSTQGVTLGSNVTVNGILTLTGSNITTASSKVLTLGSSATISGGSSSSFVNGPLARIVAATSPVTNVFPIGKGTAFRPLQLTVTQSASTPTAYTAEQFEGSPTSRTLPGSLNSVSSVRYFNITKGTGSGVTAASVQLGYDTDDLVSDASLLRIAKDNGSGTWVNLGGSGTAPTTGTITSSTNFTTFSDFVLANANSLCVLSLKALIDGFYDGSTMVSDTVTVELHNSTSPYALVESQKGVLNSSGTGTFNFTTAINGTPYFIAVKHRNALQTWSGLGQSFTSNVLSYDFTTAVTQAYASNLHLNNGKYCFWSGDVNRDSVVNLSDMIIVDNDNSHIAHGYLNSDTNGDGGINLSDMIIVDNSNSKSIRIHTPGLSKEVKPNVPEISPNNLQYNLKDYTRH